MYFVAKILLLSGFTIGIPLTITLNSTNLEPETLTPNLRRGGYIRTTTIKPSEFDFDPEDSTIPLEHAWECGTDEFSKYISASAIERDCPILKNSINNCCISHDKCYDDQRGRKFCDDTFCNCLDIATITSEICNKEDSPTFCELVREFGEEPYNLSAKAIQTTKTPLGRKIRLPRSFSYELNAKMGSL